MRKDSPLRFPTRRGPRIRYWFSAFILVLCCSMFYQIVREIIQGKVSPSRYTGTHPISLADNPEKFWFVIVIYSLGTAFLAQRAVAEIFYTNKHKRSLGRSPRPVSPAAGMEENPLHEIAKPGYTQRAFERAQRRKSPWNLILIPLVAGGWFLCTYILWDIIWNVHTMIHPEHAGIELRQALRATGAPVPLLLMFLPLLFGAMPFGMILGNVVAWCIPPARKTFAREAEGVKGTSFRAAQSGLWMLGKYILAASLLLSLIGAFLLKTLD